MRQMLRVGAHVFLDLYHQLTRGRQDEGANAAARARTHQRAEPLQQRQGKSGGLARARLRDADQIVPAENLGNGRCLNGRGLGVTGVLNGA